MRRVLLLGLAACRPPEALPADPSAALESCFREVVMHLASDDLKGREIGTPELDHAATWLARRMAALPLESATDDYLQPFDVVTGARVGDHSRLSDGGPLVRGEDFVPLGFTSGAPFAGPLVFAGYGIQAPDLGYDDYAGLDVQDRVVLAMRFEPQEDQFDSPFSGTEPSPWSSVRRKADAARGAGAQALLLVSPPTRPDRLGGARQGPPEGAGFPVFEVSQQLAARWLDAPLPQLHARIDADLRPVSRSLPVTVEGLADVLPVQARAANVVGVLRGQGALGSEVVLVGAHYDHLGFGGHGSLTPDRREIHNGADDNASGVAAMLCGVQELSRRVSGDPRPRRTLVVAAFSAEEVGLGGSGHYVRHPLLPLERTIAMVNLDMVGRVRDGRLLALGSDTAPEWAPLLMEAAAASGLELETGGSGYGPSDHTSFTTKKIPVVHLFSGEHPEYHSPDDEVSTLNHAGGARVAALLVGTLERLLGRPTGLTYTETGAPDPVGEVRQFDAWLGTLPDFGAVAATSGVLLGGVVADSPADHAGLQSGDRLIRLGTHPIRTVQDLAHALKSLRPGDEVTVTIVRDGQGHTTTARLADRPLFGGGFSGPWEPAVGERAARLRDPREVWFADLRQLGGEGDQLAPTFSEDGRTLSWWSRSGSCEQRVQLDLDTGERRTDDEACSSPLPTHDQGPAQRPQGPALTAIARDGHMDLHLEATATRPQTRISFSPGFDGYPAFSPDGRWVAFSSDRGGSPGDTALRVFLARWVERIEKPTPTP